MDLENSIPHRLGSTVIRRTAYQHVEISARKRLPNVDAESYTAADLMA